MKKTLTQLVFLCLILASMLANGHGQKKMIAPAGHDVGLPFTAAIQSGDFIYVSGMIGNKPGTREVSADFGAQLRQTLDNAKAVLAEAGAGLQDVVSVNVYLADTRHFPSLNEIYRQYFSSNPPVRTTVEADMVISGALVELSMVAARPGVKKEVVVPEGWQVSGSPFSPGIKAAETLFISGAVAEDPVARKLLSGNIESETEAAFKNIGSILQAAGMDFDDVVSARVYLADPRDFEGMNTVFRKVFPHKKPVRATVRARLASPDVRVEIQCVAVRAEERRVFGTARPNSPFSPSVQAGGRLFLAGMTGRSPEGFVPGDVKAQTRQSLKNLGETLEQAGLSFEDVVDVTVFLSDVRFYEAMNEVYAEIFGSKAARATVGSQLVSPDALVEVMMTATVKP